MANTKNVREFRKIVKGKAKIIPLACLVLTAAGLSGQDPVFSHFYANSLHLNPALAGAEGPARFFTGYRNQWPRVGQTYVTYHAAYDQYVEQLHGGLGFRLMDDVQGDGTFNNFNLDGIYSYQFRASRWLEFSAGLQATFGWRSFDPANLQFGDMIDPVTGISSGPTEAVPAYHKLYPDFATGMAVFYRDFYGGIAIHHLLEPRTTDDFGPGSTLPRRYTLHAGAVFPILDRGTGKELIRLSPNFVFIQQQSVQQINYGLEIYYRELLAGVWTRHDMTFNYGNIIFSAGFQSGSLRFRYSYDLRLSKPSVNLPPLGAHEFSMLIIYENHNRKGKHRAIKCPKI